MDATTYRKCANPLCTKLVLLASRLRYCRACHAAGFRAAPGNQHTVKAASANTPLDVPVAPSSSSDSVVERGDERVVVKGTNEHVRTLEDLIRVCEIDTDVWEIVEWTANKWEMGWVNRNQKTPDTAHALPLFQVKARMRRKIGLIRTMEQLRQALVADIERIVSDPIPLGSYPCVEGDWLFEFAPFDLHMGKLTWDDETVTNYDLHIASDLFNASLDFLLTRALRMTGNKLSRVLFVVGNDVCHIDNKRGETTAGTHLDVDTRYIKVYRRIVEVHRRAVAVLREHAPVDIVVVPGNHDELTSFHLGEVLAALYEHDPSITVNNSPKLTKYYEFGTNLFGFCHGDSEKVSELPLTMARENPKGWARCSSREWHIGHKHISEKWEHRSKMEQDLFSDKGVRIRRLTSMSSHDAWHTKHKYMDRRACEGFIFHRTAGFTDHLSFNIDHFSGRPLEDL